MISRRCWFGRYSTEIPEGAGVARWRRQARRAGCHRANGAQPGPEGVPDELGIRDREVVKQSMADDACVDEDVVCVELALDVVAVLGRGAVKMLVAIVAAQRLHVLHPEVIAERTDLAHSLLEGELDLESQAVVPLLVCGGSHSIESQVQPRRDHGARSASY